MKKQKKKPKERSVMLTVRLPLSVQRAVKVYAAQTGQTVQAVVEFALRTMGRKIQRHLDDGASK